MVNKRCVPMCTSGYQYSPKRRLEKKIVRRLHTCLLLPFRWNLLRECKNSFGRPMTTRICEATHPQGWFFSNNFLSYLQGRPATGRSNRTTSVSRLEHDILDLMGNFVPFEEENDVASSLSLKEHFLPFDSSSIFVLTPKSSDEKLVFWKFATDITQRIVNSVLAF